MKKLLIIESIPDRHKASEGEALRQALEIMKRTWDGRVVRHLNIVVRQAFTKKSFLNLLKEESDFLHISAHGDINKTDKKNRHVLKIGKGKIVTPEEIQKSKPRAKIIFVSACFAGYFDLASAFFDKKKGGLYLAPMRNVPFDEAFLVALQFHRGAFLEKSKRKAMIYIKDLKGGIKERTYRLYEFPKDFD